MNLGPNTKAAIARLVGVLPHLHSDGAAIPTAHRGFWEGIRAKYAANHAGSGVADPKVEAAQAHAEEDISKALDADAASEAETADETAMALPVPEPAAPEEATAPVTDLPAETVEPKEGE